MKRKSFFSLLVLFLLLFTFQVFVSAEWQTDENGDTYYYQNEVPLTRGPHRIDGQLYLFRADGTLIQDQVTRFNKKLYVSRANGTLITSLTTYRKKQYYGTADGSCKLRLVKFGNEYAYFDPKTGAAVKNSWVTYGGHTFYFNQKARAIRGKGYDIDGGRYFFNSKGYLFKDCVLNYKGAYYVLGKKTGKMQLGSVKYGNYWYYLRQGNNADRGKALTNNWKSLNGKYYYYDGYGRRQMGWLVLNGKRYYLDPSNKGARTYGKKTINGQTYDFGTKGYISYTPSGKPLTIRVNRKSCVVTIYDNGIPVKAMTCSTGASGSPTPTGTFMIQDHLAWHTLNGPSMGQYCSHFLPSYLFHSVPAYGTSRNPYGVNGSDYNRLGTPASGGCIRLCVADAKWIYYNAPIGSTVIISDTEATPLGKPATQKMTPGVKGKDPTDDLRNPAGYDVY